MFWNKIRENYGSGYFAQGTIYPDRIESGKGDAAKIKTHHNQVEVPQDITFEGIIEPLQDLFKDEVRVVGKNSDFRTSLYGVSRSRVPDSVFE